MRSEPGLDQTRRVITIVEIPVAPGAEQDRLCHDVAAVDAAANLARYGRTDLADSASRWVSSLATQRYTTKTMLLARGGDTDEPLGWLHAALPLTDNTRLAGVQLVVDPAAPVADIVSALLADLTPRLRTAGRHVVQVWSAHGRPTDPEAPRLDPASGAGHLQADALALALIGAGFTLEQVERYSVLDVPAAVGPVHGLAERAARAAAGYDTLTWVDATPADVVDQMAALRSRMSVDAPAAGLEVEEEVWDAERVRHTDQAVLAAGRSILTTAGRHVASGQLVAYTQLTLPHHTPEVAFQEDTLVHGGHRGHRLGMLVKTRNLLALAERAPAVRRVHTWNADENAHMLAINVELGFRTEGAVGGWQLRLEP